MAVWQEDWLLLVSPDEVRDHDRLRFTVFDAIASRRTTRLARSKSRCIASSQVPSRWRSAQYHLLETRNRQAAAHEKGYRGSGHAQVQCGLLWSRHAPGTGHALVSTQAAQGITTTAKDDSASIDLVSP